MTVKNMRLKQLTKESQITTEQLANYLDIDQIMMKQIENGTTHLNVTGIEKICSLFGCCDTYLMGEEDVHLPLNWTSHSLEMMSQDLQCLAAINKIIMNIRYMNKKIEEQM